MSPITSYRPHLPCKNAALRAARVLVGMPVKRTLSPSAPSLPGPRGKKVVPMDRVQSRVGLLARFYRILRFRLELVPLPPSGTPPPRILRLLSPSLHLPVPKRETVDYRNEGMGGWAARKNVGQGVREEWRH